MHAFNSKDNMWTYQFWYIMRNVNVRLNDNAHVISVKIVNQRTLAFNSRDTIYLKIVQYQTKWYKKCVTWLTNSYKLA